jgi:hypothetical protein
MSDQTNVEIIDEVCIRYSHGGTICLQAVRYHHPNDPPEDGFRFSSRDGIMDHLPQPPETLIVLAAARRPSRAGQRERAYGVASV